MADKVYVPGVVGLTNFRHTLNRPMYGTIPQGTHSRQYALRRQPGGRYWRPYNPADYIPVNRDVAQQVSRYVGTTTQKRKPKKSYKKTCCQYIKGKKRCSPNYCPKKRRFRKKFYWE